MDVLLGLKLGVSELLMDVYKTSGGENVKNSVLNYNKNIINKLMKTFKFNTSKIN